MAKEPEKSISTESMENIISQTRKIKNGKIDKKLLTETEHFTTYNFEDSIDGGQVSVSFYPASNSFVGHHHGLTKPFGGVLHDKTARIDVDGASIDLYV